MDGWSTGAGRDEESSSGAIGIGNVVTWVTDRDMSGNTARYPRLGSKYRRCNREIAHEKVNRGCWLRGIIEDPADLNLDHVTGLVYDRD